MEKFGDIVDLIVVIIAVIVSLPNLIRVSSGLLTLEDYGFNTITEPAVIYAIDDVATAKDVADINISSYQLAFLPYVDDTYLKDTERTVYGASESLTYNVSELAENRATILNKFSEYFLKENGTSAYSVKLTDEGDIQIP